MKCGRMLDIPLIDHVIVAGEIGETSSFQREGLMQQLEKDQKDWTR